MLAGAQRMCRSVSGRLMDDQTRRFNFVVLVIGVILAVWSATAISERFAFIAASVATPGMVVRLNDGAHHPQIAFVTQGGEPVSFPASFVSVAVGDTVPVRHDPARPRATAEVDTFMNDWLGSIMPSVFMVAFLYAGFTGQSLRPRYGRG
ncbi:DUF3592 domain-containing protein [Burkholderia stabilis]|uniref:DUF3592 domain-containing protein n=1 Tax=Burkholderia stabilis TaxID=95485 RepID=UPI0015911E16|nr:DUF3592 domain-containing protein [Burkholderia stabilis]